MKNKFLNGVALLLCAVTIYATTEVVKFIDQSKKNQQEQDKILHEISYVLKKIKLPPTSRTFTVDAAVQAGATIIINEGS